MNTPSQRVSLGEPSNLVLREQFDNVIKRLYSAKGNMNAIDSKLFFVQPALTDGNPGNIPTSGQPNLEQLLSELSNLADVLDCGLAAISNRI